MELEFLVLGIAIFGASVLQALTEVGFGVIADPALLVVLSDCSTIQISVFLSLLITTILARKKSSTY